MLYSSFFFFFLISAKPELLLTAYTICKYSLPDSIYRSTQPLQLLLMPFVPMQDPVRAKHNQPLQNTLFYSTQCKTELSRPFKHHLIKIDCE